MGNRPQTIETNVHEHERLGLIKLSEPPESQDEYQKVQIQRAITSEKQYNEWLQRVRQIDNEITRELIYLPQKFRFEPSGLCGNSGTAYQTEIWFLLYKMVQAEAAFERLHFKIGDFSPKSVLLNQNGQIRIISSASLPNQTDNYTKITQHILADVYLAPEEISLQNIDKARYPPKVDPNRAELFCIGITLIEAASLQDCSFIYTRNPLKIQIDKLQKLKSNLSQRYTGFLCQIIKEITQIDAKKRRTAQNIIEILRPFEHAILDLQPVNWNNVHYSSVKNSAFFNEGSHTMSKISSGTNRKKGFFN